MRFQRCWQVVLSSKRLPDSVPAYTIDRQCGSAQQALHLAAQAVMSGTQDCVIAGGVEMMSVVPMDSNVDDTWKGGPHTGDAIRVKYGERMQAEYAQFAANPVKFDQFVGAELVAKKYGVTRQDADEFALRSHALANAAAKAGRFPEIVPLPCRSREGISKAAAPDQLHTVDEGIRPQSSAATLAKLKPILQNGALTAAAASQICDGSSAMLVCNERGLQRLGLRPRARVVSLGLAGLDPILMLEGPIPATKQALGRAVLPLTWHRTVTSECPRTPFSHTVASYEMPCRYTMPFTPCRHTMPSHHAALRHAVTPYRCIRGAGAREGEPVDGRDRPD